MLRDVGQRLGRHEVGRELHRLRAAAARRRRPPTWAAPPAAPGRPARRPGRVPGTPGGCRGRARAAPASDSGELVARGARRAARPPPGRGGSRRWISESCSASVTSRCWAPSCRLRSMRRRSASAAVTMRSREACSSASRARDLGVQLPVLQRDPGRHPDRLDELGVVLERPVVDQDGDALAVAVDRRDRPPGVGSGTAPDGRRRRRGRRRAGTRAAAAGRPARGPARPAVRPGRSSAGPGRGPRRPRARQPRAQQAREERDRHRDQRAGGEPEERLRLHADR